MTERIYENRILTKSSAAFYSVNNSNSFINHQAIKNQNQTFNFRNQAFVQSRPISLKINPQVPQRAGFQSGASSQCIIPQFNGLFDNFYLHLTIKNNHATEQAVLPSDLTHLIQKIVVKKGVDDIQTTQSSINSLMNNLEINITNQTLLTGLKSFNYDETTENTIAAQSEKTFIITLYTVLSNTFLPRNLLTAQELKLEIFFRQNVIFNPTLLTNQDLEILKQDLFVQYVDIPSNDMNTLVKHTFLDYLQLQTPDIQTYQFSDSTAKVNQTIDLKSYDNNCLGMIIWISKQNPANDELNLRYPIWNVQFLDSQNNSMINNRIIDQEYNKLNILEHFPNSKYIQDKNNTFFVIPFSLNIEKSIKEQQVLGCGFNHQGQDYRLSISSQNNLAGAYFVNVLYLTYKYVRVQNGTFILVNS